MDRRREAKGGSPPAPTVLPRLFLSVCAVARVARPALGAVDESMHETEDGGKSGGRGRCFRGRNVGGGLLGAKVPGVERVCPKSFHKFLSRLSVHLPLSFSADAFCLSVLCIRACSGSSRTLPVLVFISKAADDFKHQGFWSAVSNRGQKG